MLTLQVCDEDKVKENILKHLANVWHPVNIGLPFSYTQIEEVNSKTLLAPKLFKLPGLL